MIVLFLQAVLWYWMTTNVFSLCQVGMLRIPFVRETLKIGKIVKHDKIELPYEKNKKNFRENIRESKF